MNSFNNEGGSKGCDVLKEIRIKRNMYSAPS